MAFSPIPVLGLGILLLLLVYRYVVEPAFVSRLSKIPAAHWSAPFSPFWIYNHRRKQRETFVVHAAHQKYGPIIRLAPNELSVNCVDGGIRSIYGGGYEKKGYYSNVFTNYGGVPPMFAMDGHAEHSKRKRMLSNIYAKSTLQKSDAVDAISRIHLLETLLPKLEKLAEKRVEFDIYDIFVASTLDFVCAYTVGLRNATHLLDDVDHAGQFARNYKRLQQFTFWQQELPFFTALLRKFGLQCLLYPTSLVNAHDHVEDWILEMCDKAEITLNAIDGQPEKLEHPEDYPCVYAQLRSSIIKDVAKSDVKLPIEQVVRSHRLEIASEIVDHVVAGWDTSSITLTWLTWQLSRPENFPWQGRLREEIAALKGDTDPREIDALPVLHAILMETLRLHAAIPGNQPRITPAGATLGPPDHRVPDLPAGVRVQAQAWSLHRNPDVFPDPDSWLPARWLDADEAQQKEMARWFWAFGSGGRMCVGSNLAMYEIKAIIALIWGHFTTNIANDEGMVANGGYLAEPVGKDGKFLVVKLERVA